MDLYFSPMRCSLASRIALYEAGVTDVRFIEVDSKTKRTTDGEDYLKIYPLGMVPLLRLDDRSLLSETAAILQYIAARNPQSGLVPRSEAERTQLQQWLCFIGTELHKGLFVPLLDKLVPEGTRAYVLKKYESRLRYLDDHLRGREYLLDRFSVADAYLYAVLLWTMPTRVDLAPYPAIKCYLETLQTRPSVAKAYLEDMALYRAELARQQAAA
jgi:glutathione S-transferase